MQKDKQTKNQIDDIIDILDDNVTWAITNIGYYTPYSHFVRFEYTEITDETKPGEGLKLTFPCDSDTYWIFDYNEIRSVHEYINSNIHTYKTYGIAYDCPKIGNATLINYKLIYEFSEFPRTKLNYIYTNYKICQVCYEWYMHNTFRFPELMLDIKTNKLMLSNGKPLGKYSFT